MVQGRIQAEPLKRQQLHARDRHRGPAMEATTNEGSFKVHLADPRAMRLFRGVLQSLAKISPDVMLEAKPGQVRARG